MSNQGVINLKKILEIIIEKQERKMIELEEMIIKTNPADKTKFQKLKFQKNGLEIDMKENQRIWYILNNFGEKFINLKKYSKYIMDLKIETSYKLECLLYLYNNNLEYIINEIVFNNKDVTEKNSYYLKLRTIINSNNWVNKLKNPDYELFQFLIDIGFEKEAAVLIFDASLREYEYSIIYGDEEILKLTK